VSIWIPSHRIPPPYNFSTFFFLWSGSVYPTGIGPLQTIMIWWRRSPEAYVSLERMLSSMVKALQSPNQERFDRHLQLQHFHCEIPFDVVLQDSPLKHSPGRLSFSGSPSWPPALRKRRPQYQCWLMIYLIFSHSSF